MSTPSFEQVIDHIAAHPANALQRRFALALAGKWPYSLEEELCLNLLTSGHPLKALTTTDGRDIITYADFCGPWVLASEMEAFKSRYQEPYVNA